MNRRTLAAAALAAAALAGTALATAGAAAAATPRRCAAADLRVTLAPTGGSGAGTLEFGVVLRNLSTASCRLQGFPGLGLLDADEKAIPGYAAFDRTRTPRRVILAANGGRAHAIVRYSDVPTGDETCRRSAFLLVTPPNGRVANEVRAAIRPCNAGRMLVSPVLAGPIAS